MKIKKFKSKSHLKYKLIKEKLDFKSLDKIISILKSENSSSILANLSNKNITKYLDIVIKQDNMSLFIVKNSDLIGYAIVTEKPEYLISNFKKLKIPFLIDLIIRLKILTLINIFLSIIKIDTLFINFRNKKIVNRSLNLNLLAIKKKYQGIGVGTKFLKFIIKKTKKNSKYISCETNDKRSKEFYEKKLNFRTIGWKIRVPIFINILLKRI